MPGAIDNRRLWKRLFWPSREYERTWVSLAKIIGWPTFFIVAVTVIVLFANGTLPPRESYTVTIDQRANGDVSISENRCASLVECTVKSGDNLTIRVDAEDGYKLEDLDCPECRLNVLAPARTIEIQNIRGNLTITPNFRRAGTVRVDSARGGATCTVISDRQSGDTCTEFSGGEIELSAEPEIPEEDMSFEMWDFSSEAWTRGVDLTRPTIEVTVPSSLGTLRAIAIYSRQVELTIGSAPNGSVRADCERTDNCRRAEGWRTTVTATPDDGYEFAGWDCDGSCPSDRSSSSVELRIDRNTHITPSFREIPTFTVTLSSNGNGSASINDGRSCAGGCSFRRDTEITIVATPDSSRYNFDGWSGDSNSSTDEITVTVTENLRFVANFVIDTDRLTVEIDGEGSVETSEGNCTSSPCRFTVEDGTRVTLNARPGSGYDFERWSGDISGTNTSASITVTQNSEVTAVFKRLPVHCTGNDVRNVFYPSPLEDNGSGGTLRFDVVFNKACDTASFSYQLVFILATDFPRRQFSGNVGRNQIGQYVVQLGLGFNGCNPIQNALNREFVGEFRIDGRGYGREVLIKCL